MLTDSLTGDSYSAIFTPKLRLQTICCFVGGASSSERQLSPVQFTYRSLKDHRKIFADEGRVRQGQIERGLYAQHIQLACNTVTHPQISSTGCSESSFRVLCGFPVRASTPRNCFHF